MLQFTLQLSLSCFAEYVLHLTRLNPDMMYIHQDSGLVNVSYFKFDVDDTSGECWFFALTLALHVCHVEVSVMIQLSASLNSMVQLAITLESFFISHMTNIEEISAKK